MKQRVQVPSDVSFDDLGLTRDAATGAVEFSWEPIECICKVSNLNLELFKRATEDNVAGLIISWYTAHRKAVGRDLSASGGQP